MNLFLVTYTYKLFESRARNLFRHQVQIIIQSRKSIIITKKFIKKPPRSNPINQFESKTRYIFRLSGSISTAVGGGVLCNTSAKKEEEGYSASNFEEIFLFSLSRKMIFESRYIDGLAKLRRGIFELIGLCIS